MRVITFSDNTKYLIEHDDFALFYRPAKGVSITKFISYTKRSEIHSPLYLHKRYRFREREMEFDKNDNRKKTDFKMCHVACTIFNIMICMQSNDNEIILLLQVNWRKKHRKHQTT